MRLTLLINLGLSVSASIGLGFVPSHAAFGQSSGNRQTCLMAAQGNGFAAAQVSAQGIDCTRYGISKEISQGIQSRGEDDKGKLTCIGSWNSNTRVCMPNNELQCRRQGYVWSEKYRECFSR